MGEYTFMEKVKLFFKQLFCRHPWFDIEKWDGWQTCTCIKCGKMYYFKIK